MCVCVCVCVCVKGVSDGTGGVVLTVMVVADASDCLCVSLGSPSEQGCGKKHSSTATLSLFAMFRYPLSISVFVVLGSGVVVFDYSGGTGWSVSAARAPSGRSLLQRHRYDTRQLVCVCVPLHVRGSVAYGIACLTLRIPPTPACSLFKCAILGTQ